MYTCATDTGSLHESSIPPPRFLSAPPPPRFLPFPFSPVFLMDWSLLVYVEVDMLPPVRQKAKKTEQAIIERDMNSCTKWRGHLQLTRAPKGDCSTDKHSAWQRDWQKALSHNFLKLELIFQVNINSNFKRPKFKASSLPLHFEWFSQGRFKLKLSPLPSTTVLFHPDVLL